MTTAEAATRAGLSIKTIQKHIRSGLLQATPGARRGRGNDQDISEEQLATYLATPHPGPGNHSPEPRTGRARRKPQETP